MIETPAGVPHVCHPPGDDPAVGALWKCQNCYSHYEFEAVFVRELGRVVNLWVRVYEPPNHTVAQSWGGA